MPVLYPAGPFAASAAPSGPSVLPGRQGGLDRRPQDKIQILGQNLGDLKCPGS